MFAKRGALCMSKLRSLCNRLARREGLRFCVLAPRRGLYRVYRFSSVMNTWYNFRTFGCVADCESFLRSYERP